MPHVRRAASWLRSCHFSISLQPRVWSYLRKKVNFDNYWRILSLFTMILTVLSRFCDLPENNLSNTILSTILFKGSCLKSLISTICSQQVMVNFTASWLNCMFMENFSSVQSPWSASHEIEACSVNRCNRSVRVCRVLRNHKALGNTLIFHVEFFKGLANLSSFEKTRVVGVC